MHNYDPSDLVTSFAETNHDGPKTPSSKKTPTSVQAIELEQAVAKGVLVDLDVEQTEKLAVNSPVSVQSNQSPSSADLRELDLGNEDDNLEGDDSDDDIL